MPPDRRLGRHATQPQTREVTILPPRLPLKLMKQTGEGWARPEKLQGKRQVGTGFANRREGSVFNHQCKSSATPSPPQPTPLPGASPGSTQGQPPPRCVCGCYSEGPGWGQPEAPPQGQTGPLNALGPEGPETVQASQVGRLPGFTATCAEQRKTAGAEGSCNTRGALLLGSTGQAEAPAPSKDPEAPSPGEHRPSRGSSPFIGSRS